MLLRAGESGKMDGLSRKALTALAVLASAAVFFPLALSDLPNEYKLPLIAAVLYLSGEALRRTANLTGYGPFLLWKGEGGFSIMKRLARKHPRLFREANDFGLSLCFGVPYAWWLFRGRTVKWLAHGLAIALLFYLLQLSVLPQYEALRAPLFAVGMLGGLCGFGIMFVALHAWTILTVPAAPAGVMPIVPGVTIPFWEGLIAIFIAAVVHELSHGIIALVEKLRLESSGGIFLGFLPVGAFVEPDEKQFARVAIHKKRRVLVAGSAANFLIFVLASLLAPLLLGAFTATIGEVRVDSVAVNGTARGVLSVNDTLLAVDGSAVRSAFEISPMLQQKGEGDVVRLTVRGQDGRESIRTVTLGSGGKMGITVESIPAEGLGWLTGILLFLISTTALTAMLNFALSMINIMPLFITDGHRLLYEELAEKLGKRKEHDAKVLANIASTAILLLLLVNALPLLIPDMLPLLPLSG